MVDFIRFFYKFISIIILAVNVCGVVCISIGKFVFGNSGYFIISNSFVEFSMIISFVGIVIEPIMFAILLLNGIVLKNLRLIVGDVIVFILALISIILFLSCLTIWVGI